MWFYVNTNLLESREQDFIDMAPVLLRRNLWYKLQSKNFFHQYQILCMKYLGVWVLNKGLTNEWTGLVSCF